MSEGQIWHIAVRCVPVTICTSTRFNELTIVRYAAAFVHSLGSVGGTACPRRTRIAKSLVWCTSPKIFVFRKHKSSGRVTARVQAQASQHGF